MVDIPLKSKLYAIAILLGTVSVFAVSASHGMSDWLTFDRQLALVLVVLLVLVERLKIELLRSSVHLNISVGSILSLAVCLVFSPVVAAVVVMLAILIDDLWDRRRPIQAVVNVCVLGMSAFFAAYAYQLIAIDGQTPLANLRNLTASVVASLTYSLINTGLLAFVIAPVVQESTFRLWKSSFGIVTVFVPLPLMGGLVPVVALENPFAVPILLLPLLVAHLAQRALRQSQIETQSTIESLVDALEIRDEYTHNHSVRVTEYTEKILDQMRHLPAGTRKMVVDAARVHDIGKMGVRDTALLKPGKLTDEEFEEIKRHPAIGADLIRNLEMYRRCVPIVRHHHERWDGKGYPDGLRADDIPLGARIITVADSFDAMTSDRPYRKAMTHAAALAEIRRNSGIQFDPHVVEAFLNAMDPPAPAPRVESVETQLLAATAD